MSLLDTVKTVKDRITKAAPAGAIAPGIEVELHSAETELSALEARRGDLALAVTLGDEGSSEAMAKYRSHVEAARHHVSDLRAAHVVAVARDSAAVSAAKAAVHASQIKAVRAHLASRDAALEKMSEHLADAIAQFDSAVKAGAKAATAAPSQLPGGALCSRASLDRVIAQEIYRLSAPLMAGHDAVAAAHFTFPGGHSPDLRQSGVPSEMQSLADLARETTEYLIATLNGKPWPPIAEQSEPVATEPAPAIETQPSGATIDARLVPLPAPRKLL